MRLMKIQPEKRLALFLLISVSLVWGQTGTSGRAADSSAPPTSFPAPTPAALATAEHAISGHDPGPSGPSPVTDLLKLLANVNSTEAMTSMKAIWATDRYFDFARFQETAKNVAEMMRQAGLDDVQIANGQTIRTIAREAGQCTKTALSRRIERCTQRLTETHVFKHYTLRNWSLSGA